jgi:hypothetical protein
MGQADAPNSGAAPRTHQRASYSAIIVLGEPFLGAVIKLGGARAFVRRHRLGVFQRAAVARSAPNDLTVTTLAQTMPYAWQREV